MKVVSALMAYAMLLASANAQAPDKDVVEILGMRVDFHLTTKEQRETVTASLEKQISVATSVNVPPSVLEFFRTISIVVDPAMLKMATNGEYTQNDKRPCLRIKPIALQEERAIILHELMHAYHHQVLKQVTPDIDGAYARAKLDGVYPPEYRNAAFLVNSREYFANMATTFLLGKSERAPFSCSVIIKAQPKFVTYLASIFGEHPCG